MVDKTISAAKLLELHKSGASIKLDQRPMVIEQFADLIEQLKNLIAAQEKRAAADLARSQTQLEIMGTLQTLIKQQRGVTMSPPLDLEPLKTVLVEMHETSHHEPYDYDFNIVRNGPGLSPMVKVEARVIRPTLN